MSRAGPSCQAGGASEALLRVRGYNAPMDRLSASPIEVFDSLASTNDSLHESARAGAAEGTTHVALLQTAGRGRGDHEWWSPPGSSLAMSTLLRPSQELRGSDAASDGRRDWGGLALVAGAAVLAAVRDLGARGVELYWPNDLYIGKRKLGGILCESKTQAGESWIVVGIGLNIDLTSPEMQRGIPDELRDQIICLTEAGPVRVRRPRELAVAILAALGPLYDRFQRGVTLPRLVGEDLAHRGKRVEVDAPGRPTMEGVVSGLTDRGELLVRDLAGCEHIIRAAEVRYEH